jgi:hypothetical protein
MMVAGKFIGEEATREAPHIDVVKKGPLATSSTCTSPMKSAMEVVGHGVAGVRKHQRPLAIGARRQRGITHQNWDDFSVENLVHQARDVGPVERGDIGELAFNEGAHDAQSFKGPGRRACELAKSEINGELLLTTTFPLPSSFRPVLRTPRARVVVVSGAGSYSGGGFKAAQILIQDGFTPEPLPGDSNWRRDFSSTHKRAEMIFRVAQIARRLGGADEGTASGGAMMEIFCHFNAAD